MPKIHDLRNGDDVRYVFNCPGCGDNHAPSNKWTFNGDYEKPTFSPSILVRGTKRISEDEAKRIMRGEHIEPIPYVCHSFVTDGKIQFLSDCTHELAGQTIEIPEWDDD